jgi:prepilin-type N-terminal cleavage/methylation domain-containing protein
MIYCKRDRGFSLIELLIILGIMAILLAIAAPQFSVWITKYNIEAQVRQLYGDLSNARAQAMYRNRTHFVVGAANIYQVIDDVNLNNAADDAAILTVNTVYPMVSDGPAIFSFDSRGMSNVDPAGTGATVAVCVPSTVSPDLDCLRISSSRIQLGKMTAQGGGCNAIICQAR